MKLLDALLSLLIPALVLLHLAVAPYTKVEESFNMQATHDLLVYGMPRRDVARSLAATYDHFTFPGAVPRTFVGAVLLAGLGQPFVALAGFAHAQLVVRAILGLFNAAALLFLARGLGKTFGVTVRRWFLVLLAGQFHVIFYASRTLPNMFAFGLSTLALTCLLPQADSSRSLARHRQAISLLVFATAVFRSELAILLVTSTLYLLGTRQITVARVIPPFLISFIAALLISVPIDSYFWQKPLWPELWGFYYNAVLGSSSDWGVSPWHYYFTSALPRLLVNPLIPLVLIPLALYHPATSKAARSLVLPSLLFVAIYSAQPHKEARFISYAVPPLTAAGAMGANLIFARRTKSALYGAGTVILGLSVFLSFAVSTGMLLISSLNYPGGEALAQLYSIVSNGTTTADANTVTAVHTDVLSCMTGVTLFGQNPAGLLLALDSRFLRGAEGVPRLEFDKTEEPVKLRDPKFWQRFDYLLVEDPSKVRGGEWDVVGVVSGFGGVEVLRPARDSGDLEAAKAASTHNTPKLLGKGAQIAALRDALRKYTGGWWIGPRMVPRISILRKVKDTERRRRSQEAVA